MHKGGGPVHIPYAHSGVETSMLANGQLFAFCLSSRGVSYADPGVIVGYYHMLIQGLLSVIIIC